TRCPATRKVRDKGFLPTNHDSGRFSLIVPCIWLIVINCGSFDVPLINFGMAGGRSMPPDPWKLLKNIELTPQQRRELRNKLAQRQRDLKAAMDAIEKALALLSGSISERGKSKYRRKVK